MTPDYKAMTPEEAALQIEWQRLEEEEIVALFQAQRAAGRAEGVRL